MSRNPLIAALIVVAFAFASGEDRAQAQVKPFKINGGGLAPDGLSLIPGVPAFHNATGQATELGRYSGAGFFTILDYTGPLTAEFSSAPYFVFTAANGDNLVCTYGVSSPGEVTLTPHSDGSVTAVFVAEFNPVPALCTGRFAKLTGGGFLMIAKSSPFFLLFDQFKSTPFTYTWEGVGTLEYGKGN
jgi:hypothetical protein